MSELKIVTVTIQGPTQTGKSWMMDRIQKALAELGVTVHSPDLAAERRLATYDAEPQAWERKMLENSIVHLREARP